MKVKAYNGLQENLEPSIYSNSDMPKFLFEIRNVIHENDMDNNDDLTNVKFDSHHPCGSFARPL
jgi:hypothetical protein